METNLDDLSPEITGHVFERLLTLGALDVFLTPVQMKKNRPGVLLTVLVSPENLGKIQDAIFADTTSFGMRMQKMERCILDREFHNVSTPFGMVTVKLGRREGKIIQRAPEYESCRIIAEKSNRPLREIYSAAAQAAQALQ